MKMKMKMKNTNKNKTTPALNSCALGGLKCYPRIANGDLEKKKMGSIAPRLERITARKQGEWEGKRMELVN